jgi:hypothetical protein
MRFKSDKLKLQWENSRLNPHLKKMILGLDELCEKQEWPEIIITSIYRRGKISEHGAWRAIDFRVIDSDGGRKWRYTFRQTWLMFNFCRRKYGRRDTFSNGLQKIPLYFHKGTAWHGHCSVDK